LSHQSGGSVNDQMVALAYSALRRGSLSRSYNSYPLSGQQWFSTSDRARAIVRQGSVRRHWPSPNQHSQPSSPAITAVAIAPGTRARFKGATPSR